MIFFSVSSFIMMSWSWFSFGLFEFKNFFINIYSLFIFCSLAFLGLPTFLIECGIYFSCFNKMSIFSIDVSIITQTFFCFPTRLFRTFFIVLSSSIGILYLLLIAHLILRGLLMFFLLFLLLCLIYNNKNLKNSIRKIRR